MDKDIFQIMQMKGNQLSDSYNFCTNYFIDNLRDSMSENKLLGLLNSFEFKAVNLSKTDSFDSDVGEIIEILKIFDQEFSEYTQKFMYNGQLINKSGISEGFLEVNERNNEVNIIVPKDSKQDERKIILHELGHLYHQKYGRIKISQTSNVLCELIAMNFELVIYSHTNKFIEKELYDRCYFSFMYDLLILKSLRRAQYQDLDVIYDEFRCELGNMLNINMASSKIGNGFLRKLIFEYFGSNNSVQNAVDNMIVKASIILNKNSLFKSLDSLRTFLIFMDEENMSKWLLDAIN